MDLEPYKRMPLDELARRLATKATLLEATENFLSVVNMEVIKHGSYDAWVVQQKERISQLEKETKILEVLLVKKQLQELGE